MHTVGTIDVVFEALHNLEPRGYVVGWIIAISLLVGILIFLLLAVLLWKIQGLYMWPFQQSVLTFYVVASALGEHGLRVSMLYTCELAGTFTQQTDPCEVAGLGVKGQRWAFQRVGRWHIRRCLMLGRSRSWLRCKIHSEGPELTRPFFTF
ncbi:hypothetical protein J1605_009978 [Eschrichtius robustus]|uniref:Uncharacterized protein n=1 Tax=Eschrichtius robustus TaxID=9764 RepID=A0AB34GW79_ESCRO|nr:hypothetical protein J1605_009978 [Eschrichtius robustus]